MNPPARGLDPSRRPRRASGATLALRRAARDQGLACGLWRGRARRRASSVGALTGLPFAFPPRVNRSLRGPRRRRLALYLGACVDEQSPAPCARPSAPTRGASSPGTASASSWGSRRWGSAYGPRGRYSTGWVARERRSTTPTSTSSTRGRSRKGTPSGSRPANRRRRAGRASSGRSCWPPSGPPGCAAIGSSWPPGRSPSRRSRRSPWRPRRSCARSPHAKARRRRRGSCSRSPASRGAPGDRALACYLPPSGAPPTSRRPAKARARSPRAPDALVAFAWAAP